MTIFNLHNHLLRTRAYLNATDAQQSTWVNLSVYCCSQENGGKIPAAASWSDMEWLLATGKTKAHVMAACDLWRFTDDGDCIVAFYPLDQEAKHKAKREGGKEGNRRRYAKKSPPVASDAATRSESDSESEQVGGVPTDSESSSVIEVNRIEGKGMEVNRTSALSPAAVTGGTLDAETDDGGQGAIGEFAEWPTREEWLAACDMEALPRELALREWNNQESKTPAQRWQKASGPIDRSRLRHHAAYVKDFARQRGELGSAEKKFRPPATTGNAGAATMAAMEAMGADLTRASEYPAALKEAVKP